MMYVDSGSEESTPIWFAWILIFTPGGALMRTRQVWLVSDVVGFSKVPVGENN